MHSLVLAILGFVWKAFVFKAGVEWLSPKSNDKRERATMKAMLYLVFFFSIIEGVLAVLGLIPVVGVLAGGLYLLTYLYIFAVYFGLGFFRTLGLAVVQFIGMAAFFWILGGG